MLCTRPSVGLVMWLKTSGAPSWPVLVKNGSSTRWQVQAFGSNLPERIQSLSVVHSSRLVSISNVDGEMNSTSAINGVTSVASAYRLAYEYIRDKGVTEQQKQLLTLGSYLGVEAQRYWVECSDAVERMNAALAVGQVALYDAIYEEKELQDVEAEAAVVVEEAKADVSGAREALEVARRRVMEAEAEHAKKVSELADARKTSSQATAAVRRADEMMQTQLKQLEEGKLKLQAANRLRKQLKEQQQQHYVHLEELTPLKVVHLDSSEVSTLQNMSPSRVADMREISDKVEKSKADPLPTSAPQPSTVAVTKKKERRLPWIPGSDLELSESWEEHSNVVAMKTSNICNRRRNRIVENENEDESDGEEDDEGLESNADDDLQVIELKAKEPRRSTRKRRGGRVNYKEGSKQQRTEDCNIGVRTRSRRNSDLSFEAALSTRKARGNRRGTRARSCRTTLDFNESDSD